MKVINKHDKPTLGVSISIVKNDSVIYKSTTGTAGAIQCSKETSQRANTSFEYKRVIKFLLRALT